jgi:hypothetical protein
VSAALTVALGVAMTLCVAGYQFGKSNHTVYLIDALRRTDPNLLRNDWWTQSTLQYHFVFNALTAALMRWGVLQPAFLLGYLALAVLLHVGWRKLTLRLGGSDGTYLLSVILYYLLAGGVALGTYQFLQDSAFLPSNIANVAMLWGIYFWTAGLPASAGMCLGLAGLFHINHALAGIGLWAGASLLEGRRGLSRRWMIGTVALLVGCAAQIVPALHVVLSRSGKLPLNEFVDLFVRVRHPHHFDPRTWHWGIWASFAIALPFAAIAARRQRQERPSPELRRATVLFSLFLLMQVIALLGAGFWFASETLVQLNLYRFSIFPKLLSCIAVAWLLWGRAPRFRAYTTAAGIALLVIAFTATLVIHARHPSPVAVHNLRVAWVFAPLAVAAMSLYGAARQTTQLRVLLVLLVIAAVGVQIGHRPLPVGIELPGLQGDDPDYRSVAAWAREHTPVDAVFLVPPNEESFRLLARRAIVVNFKGVPQLSAELPEWRDRLLAVLDLRSTADLLALPRPMGRTLQAIRSRYDALPPEHLFAVARKFGARYVVLTRPADPPAGATVAHTDTNRRYFVYDLNAQP